MQLPFFACPISAGYPSPAQDYTEESLDLNAYLVRNPAATFFMRVAESGAHMADVHPGDILVVDRSLQPCNGNTIVASVEGELLVRHWSDLTEASCELWGVVTFTIHATR